VNYVPDPGNSTSFVTNFAGGRVTDYGYSSVPSGLHLAIPMGAGALSDHYADQNSIPQMAGSTTVIEGDTVNIGGWPDAPQFPDFNLNIPPMWGVDTSGFGAELEDLMSQLANWQIPWREGPVGESDWNVASGMPPYTLMQEWQNILNRYEAGRDRGHDLLSKTHNDTDVPLNGYEIGDLVVRTAVGWTTLNPPASSGAVLSHGLAGGVEWNGPADDVGAMLAYAGGNEIEWRLPMEFGHPTATFNSGTSLTLDPCNVNGTDIAGAANVLLYASASRQQVAVTIPVLAANIISFVRYPVAATGGQKGVVVGGFPITGLPDNTGGDEGMVVRMKQDESGAGTNTPGDWEVAHNEVLA